MPELFTACLDRFALVRAVLLALRLAVKTEELADRRTVLVHLAGVDVRRILKRAEALGYEVCSAGSLAREPMLK
jgi:hypothetical protein